MAAYNYNTVMMTDWPLLPYGQVLITAIQKYDEASKQA
ncbi:hypothetical protein A2U01_0075617, partial [Trifolium medium]|nr:hypothetical protein [Trifolium medium]